MTNIEKHNEEIKNEINKTNFERDLIWGYLEDFKTILSAMKDHYGDKAIGKQLARLKYAEEIKEDLEFLLLTYPKYEK